ncbi:peptidylprolyl isomerase [Bacillus solitudinis]|uniref:peptidylprolyl isomerase n=1 Tax=Bacillus solitudinis TaxID=2014074 RepID=UPI001D0D6AF2|nr:peptidylprolyl isomerase [Bacillus solitudinis]
MCKQMIKLLLFVALFLVTGCGTQSDQGQGDQPEDQENDAVEYPVPKENPIVTITMENNEQIILELYPEIAPNTVANFISLIEDEFYNGLTFHRVIPGFMIQGGDPSGTGTGGPGYSIKGEFNSNGFENSLTHERGVISMARSMELDSAGSQFFIMVEDSPHLDGEYAAFGQVIEGIEVTDTIVGTKRGAQDKPIEDQIMKTVTVDTKGYDYPEPMTQ